MNPIAVACPQCDAPPGRRCSIGGYGSRAAKTHAARREAAQKEHTGA